MTKWPLQSDVTGFYGSTVVIATRLVQVPVPFALFYEGKVVRFISIHKMCAPSLIRVLDTILADYAELYPPCDRRAKAMSDDGTSNYSGSYVKRRMRGNRAWSMHAYGCALDFDAEHNYAGTKGRFTPTSPIVKAFEGEGWIWGGRWIGSSRDPMHFQAARLA